MSFVLPRPAAAAVLLALAALAGPPVHGQYVPPQQGQLNQGANLPPARTQAYAAMPAPPPPAYPAPYPGYYGNYYPGAAGGYLQGVAAVTNANAQYQVTIQQARLAQSQADLSKLDVRRAIQQQRDYERSLMPDPEKLRQAEIRYSLNRSRRNPPPGDIWSAVALNDLLIADQSLQRQGLYGPAVPLDPVVLRRVNVTTGTARGSVGALNGGKALQWPFTLQGERYREDREKVDRLVAAAVTETRSSQGPAAASLQEAEEAVRRMGSAVAAQIADLTPDQYIGSKRFLSQLREGLKVLEQPDAANYLDGRWAAKGRSVPELIDEMTRQGLKFAPATAGDEPYYSQLYETMITYDIALSRAAAAASYQAAAPPRR